MTISELLLRTRHLQELKDFYAGGFGLPLLAESSDSVTFSVGTTQLTFSRTPGAGDPTYHFAFNIPPRTFLEAKAWLSSRAPLLDEAGQDQFHSESWNADNIYFRDSAGNIGELIARHTLPEDSPGAFGPQHLLCVSEIGLPAPDVPEVVDELIRAFDLARYGDGSDTFSPVGDERGLFIVAQEGRPWFPTDSPAQAHTISARIDGSSEASLTLPRLPYEIRQQPSSLA